MCSRVLLMCLVAVCAAGVNASVIPSTTNFDGPTLDSPWQVGNSGATFNGAGQLVVQPTIGTNQSIWALIGQGDFSVTLDFKNLNLVVPPNGTYESFYMSIENGDSSVGMNVGSAWGYMNYSWSYNNGDGTGWHQNGEYDYATLGKPASYGTITIAWQEASKTFTISKGIDGAPVTLWQTFSGFVPSSTTRGVQIGASLWYAGDALSVGLDNAVITPEPATMSLLGLGSLVWLKRRK